MIVQSVVVSALLLGATLTPSLASRGEVRYLRENADVLGEPKLGASRKASLVKDMEVVVSRDTTADQGHMFRKVLVASGEEYPYGGFVDDATLVDLPQGYLDKLAVAKARVADGLLDQAVEAAREAIEFAPSQREPRDLMLGIFDVQDATAKARELRKELARLSPAVSPPHSSDELSSAPPAGTDGFSIATLVRVRARPSVDSPVLLELPIDSQFKLLARKDGWAHVRSERGIEGFLPERFLSAVRLQKPAALQRATELAAKNDLAGAVRWLERASALDPSDEALLHRLVESALSAGEYATAASAAWRIDRIDGGVIGVELAFGCRGDRTLASWFNESELGTSSPAMFPNACVRRATTAASNPCLCPDRELNGEAIGSAPGKSEKNQGAADAEWKASVARLRSSFPDGPFLRIDLAASVASDGRLFLYRIPVLEAEPDGRRGVGAAVIEKLTPSPPEPHAIRRTIWVPAAQYVDVVYGVVAAENDKAARAKIESFLRSNDGPPDGPGISVIGGLTKSCSAACD